LMPVENYCILWGVIGPLSSRRTSASRRNCFRSWRFITIIPVIRFLLFGPASALQRHLVEVALPFSFFFLPLLTHQKLYSVAKVYSFTLPYPGGETLTSFRNFRTALRKIPACSSYSNFLVSKRNDQGPTQIDFFEPLDGQNPTEFGAMIYHILEAVNEPVEQMNETISRDESSAMPAAAMFHSIARYLLFKCIFASSTQPVAGN